VTSDRRLPVVVGANQEDAVGPDRIDGVHLAGTSGRGEVAGLNVEGSVDDLASDEEEAGGLGGAGRCHVCSKPHSVTFVNSYERCFGEEF
jgi:hypothetical protein